MFNVGILGLFIDFGCEFAVFKLSGFVNMSIFAVSFFKRCRFRLFSIVIDVYKRFTKMCVRLQIEAFFIPFFQKKPLFLTGCSPIVGFLILKSSKRGKIWLNLLIIIENCVMELLLVILLQKNQKKAVLVTILPLE